MPKQTRASTNYRNRRSVVPPAAPRGLNQEIGTAEFVQETGDSARTAFVGPFQGGTQGEEEKEPGGQGSMGRPQGGDQRVGENRGPHGEFPTRLPARLIRQDAVRNDQVQLCVWGEEGSLTIFWERLSYLCRASTIVDHVTKVVRVWQECKARIRFDIWVTSAYVATFLGKMEPGKARYGWYFRHHIPYLERVGPSLAPAAAGAQINPPGSPTPTIPPDGFGAPLVVGTLNINGLQRKKTDLRFLLQQTRCDVMAVQETLLRSTDWQLRLPGYHCLTAMGDLTASQRGVAILVSTKFNCTPVGKATPFWTFARVYGATLLRPILVGTIYVPCRADRIRVLRALPRALDALHREFPEDPIVMMGDFNMKMTELQILMGPWRLPFRVLPIRGGASTRQSRREGQPTPAIDFITYCGDTVAAVPPARVLDTWDISDHFPVVADLPGLTRIPEMGIAPPRPESLYRRIVMEEKELKVTVANSNYWQPLADSLEEDLEDVIECSHSLENPTSYHQERLDGMAKKFTTTCHQVAEDLNLHQRVAGQNPPRVTGQVRRAIETRRRIFRETRRAESRGDREDVARLGDMYKAAKERARKVIRLSGRRAWYKAIREAHVNMREKPRHYWRWASATAGWRQKSSIAGVQPVLGPDGRLLTALTDIHQAWGAHYASLAADETGHSQEAQYWEKFDPHPQANEGIRSLDEPFTTSDIWTALRKMKSHRAPGGDGIPTELLQACLAEERALLSHLQNYREEEPAPPPSAPMTDSLGTLLNFAYERGLVAQSWAESLVVSIPKKGDLADMNNYRGISLMATVLKVVCVILGTRINVEAESRGLFSRAQAGFRQREECVTQVACVMEIIQRRRIVGEPTYVVFVDLKKAYDTVPHEALFAKLSRFGIRGRCLAFLRALYRSSTIRVRVGGGLTALYSDPCRLLRGVRQGCPLSPILFNIFIDDLAVGTEESGALVPTGDSRTWRNSTPTLTVGCTLFADDAAGICPSLEAAKRFCTHVTNWVTANEMSVGIGKCGLMEFLPPDPDPATEPLVPGQDVAGLELEGLPLPVVDRYMYLGVLMTPGLSISSMVDHRVKQGRATVATLVPFLRCPVVPMAMRLLTVAGVVAPRLLFGAELYGMNRHLTDKMQVLLNRCLRASIGARRAGDVPSVGLWKEARMLPMCALAGARRARAYAKASGLKTWLQELVLRPFRSQKWTWCSGVPRWLKRYALPHAPVSIVERYLGAGWQSLEPKVLAEVVKACILERECGIRRNLTRPSGARTVWYEGAGFDKHPLTRSRVGGSPKDQAGLALIVRCRIGAFVTVPTLVGWKRMPHRYLRKCPFCGMDEPETLEHLVFTCGRWRVLRTEPHMAELIAKVRTLGPNFALGFDQQRLAWLLGGSCDNRWVHGWMMGEPTGVTAQQNCDSSVDSSSSNGDGSQMERNPAGATTLARFLMSVVSLRANIIRSRWGSYASEAFDGVPHTSTGQRPDG